MENPDQQQTNIAEPKDRILESPQLQTFTPEIRPSGHNFGRAVFFGIGFFILAFAVYMLIDDDGSGLSGLIGGILLMTALVFFGVSAVYGITRKRSLQKEQKEASYLNTLTPEALNKELLKSTVKALVFGLASLLVYLLPSILSGILVKTVGPSFLVGLLGLLSTILAVVLLILCITTVVKAERIFRRKRALRRNQQS